MTVRLPPEHARSRALALAAAVMVALATSLLAGAPAALGAGKTIASAHHSHAPARLAIGSLTPKAPKPTSTLRISGYLHNNGKHALRGTIIRVRYSAQAIDNRSNLQSYAAASPRSAMPGSVAAHRTTIRSLAPGHTAHWTLKLPLAGLGLRDSLGVYPIAVEAADPIRGRVAEQRTFLPITPTHKSYKALRVAWLWPLMDRPHRDVDSTFIDNSLDSSLGPQGRLGQLVSAGRSVGSKVPLTWVADPALLDDAGAMSKSHKVRTAGGVRRYPASSNSRAWLGQARSAIGTAPLATVPYADPDVTALTRAGLDSDIRSEYGTGRRVVAQRLGRPPSMSVGWPPGGVATVDTLDVLALAGARTVVLGTQALPSTTRLSYTPSGVTTLPTSDGSVRTLVADQRLSKVIGQHTAGTSSTVLAQQRFLAETALITAELPQGSRTLVLAPPRQWAPTPGLAHGLLDDSTHVPWLHAVSAAHVKHDKLSQAAPRVRRQLTYTARDRHDELGPVYLRKVKRIRLEAERFDSWLAPSGAPLALAIARAESAAWRTDPVRGYRVRTEVGKGVKYAIGQVHFSNHASITLSGSKATIPVNITNRLSHHAVAVRVSAKAVSNASSTTNQLTVGHYRRLQKIQPHGSVRVEVPVTAHAVGVSTVKLTLLTPYGAPVSRPVPLRVRVSTIGSTANWITGCALGIFVVALGVRALRKRSGSNQSPGGAGDGAPEQPRPTDGPTQGPTDDPADDPAQDRATGNSSDVLVARTPADDEPHEPPFDTPGGQAEPSIYPGVAPVGEPPGQDADATPLTDLSGAGEVDWPEWTPQWPTRRDGSDS